MTKVNIIKAIRCWFGVHDYSVLETYTETHIECDGDCHPEHFTVYNCKRCGHQFTKSVIEWVD